MWFGGKLNLVIIKPIFIFRQIHYICRMKLKDTSNRQHIIEASKKAFQQLGYTQITMEDIAKASGKGRSTLYYYFKNKHDVFAEVAIEEYLTIMEPGIQKVKEAQSLSENLLGYNKSKLDFLIQKSKDYKFLISDIKENPYFIDKIFKEVRQREMALFKTCLEWGIKKNEIKPLTEEELNFLPMSMVTAASSLEKEILLYGTIENMTTRLLWLMKILIKGLK